MGGWDYKSVRHVIFTVDRRRYDDAAQAFEDLRCRVSRVVDGLRDDYGSRGIAIQDFVRVLEWHKDGFPHWHLFMLLSKPGRPGMVNLEVTTRLWRLRVGRVIVKRVRNETHWGRLVGYGMKSGYIGRGKEHQTAVPD